MNLHNDLLSVHIPHDCAHCCRKCTQRTQACVDFYPVNSRVFLDYVLAYLKENTPRSNDKIMKRHYGKDLLYKRYGFYDDGITSLDTYYVQMINDTLEQIRLGNRAYVYSIWQIQDVLRYEPYIQVRYIPDAGAYEIKLENNK